MPFQLLVDVKPLDLRAITHPAMLAFSVPKPVGGPVVTESDLWRSDWEIEISLRPEAVIHRETLDGVKSFGVSVSDTNGSAVQKDSSSYVKNGASRDQVRSF